MDRQLVSRVATDGALSLRPFQGSPKTAKSLRVETRPLAACADIVEAWTALGKRALTPNPFFDPGFLLPAAQHLVAFREIQAYLVWQDGSSERDRRLVGFLPYRRKARMLREDTVSDCADARLLCDWPLLDRDEVAATLSALLRAFSAVRTTDAALCLHALAMDNPLIDPLIAAARPDRLAVDRRTARSAGDRRLPMEPNAHLTLCEAANLRELRDGVEILIALEASGPLGRAGRATVQNTREAAFLRAMTRNLARGKLCRIALLMDGSLPLAAALTLGKGQRRWLYGAAADATQGDAGASALLETLLARMKRATPGLLLLAQGDRAVGAGAEAVLNDLTVRAASPRKPVDLARTLRARLDRGLFKPRTLVAGE